MDASVSSQELYERRRSPRPPILIDVRPDAVYRSAPDMLMGALRRDPLDVGSWAGELPSAGSVVVYCVDGEEVSQRTTNTLRERGLQGHFLQGGIETWRSSDGDLMKKPVGASTRWVTRERPKVDRIACPWLIARFIDTSAEFLYVPTAAVQQVALAREAIPYDIPGVKFSHDGELCSFDAFLNTYRLTDSALLKLAEIVRGADTARPELAPQAAGLASLSLGLSRLYADDHQMLKQGMVMYDALYLWCKEGQDEIHTWNPAAYR